MRIAIREQLATVVILAVGVALAVVSIPTWIFVNNFTLGVESDGLSLTASLKAARIASEIKLIQTACQTISTRLLLQDAFRKFYASQANNISDEDAWADARDDIQSALGKSGFSALLQARLYSRNTTGDPKGLVSITGNAAIDPGPILLPYKAPNGSDVYLGDPEYGFPPSLFPNITYRDLGRPNTAMPNTNAFSAAIFPGVSLGNSSEKAGVLLGPLVINSTYALISLTIPIRDIGNSNYILGYMTLVANTRTLVEVQTSREGLGKTGRVLFVGSTNPWNHFSTRVAASNSTWTPPFEEFGEQEVQFLLPPQPVDGQPDRHNLRSFGSPKYGQPFRLREYPAVFDVLREQIPTPSNATSRLSTTNEQGYPVAVGVARPQTPLVSWAIVVEKDRTEAYQPIKTLRSILLGCVFGTLGLILLLVFPFAHWSVMPIRRLKMATENSIDPPGYEDDDEDDDDDVFDEENPSSGGTTSGRSSEKGMIANIRRKIRKRQRAKLRQAMEVEPGRRRFKIPAKVEIRKHFITDELTELTQTFNEMTEELLKQYTSLDEKVAERTRELEISKKAAEAANESKTLFIANISHELKTPLNGIMGMCAVCMEDDDLHRIKQSLKTVYKSGDLLLHLLEDLLSFSKNQIGQQISLEEREFRLGDVRSQILAIFDKQVRESKSGLTVTFVSDPPPGQDGRSSMDRQLPALGPPGTGRLKDMCLWGDQHRILQVIINLVSNSLKFTPPGGTVNLRIRCVGEVEQPNDESRTSSFSRTGSSNRAGRTRHRMGSASVNSASSKGLPHPPVCSVNGGTALAINPADPKYAPQIHIRERSPTPPPPNAKTYLFEFEVEDTGPGIPEHMQQKIFEPFVQGDPGLSKKYGGTGLGLSICSQLATLMGGHISLKSTLGVGTTFTMQIPLKYVKDRYVLCVSEPLCSSQILLTGNLSPQRLEYRL